eukprot:scaffold18149_cov129-Isochrysis_galbana.AAC.6
MAHRPVRAGGSARQYKYSALEPGAGRPSRAQPPTLSRPSGCGRWAGWEAVHPLAAPAPRVYSRTSASTPNSLRTAMTVVTLALPTHVQLCRTGTALMLPS